MRRTTKLRQYANCGLTRSSPLALRLTCRRNCRRLLILKNTFHLSPARSRRCWLNKTSRRHPRPPAPDPCPSPARGGGAPRPTLTEMAYPSLKIILPPPPASQSAEL